VSAMSGYNDAGHSSNNASRPAASGTHLNSGPKKRIPGLEVAAWDSALSPLTPRLPHAQVTEKIQICVRNIR